MDAHSKRIEATCTSSTSSSAVIDSLRPLFARFGLPETVVTDNGPGFVSQEFEQFLKNNGIYHTTFAPYHPASNGLAERAVQTVKKGLKKEKSGNMTSRLSKVLLAYRMTPQSTTGNSPAEMLLGRRPRTRLDLLKPNTAERVERRQQEQKIWHDKSVRSRLFSVAKAHSYPVYSALFWHFYYIFYRTNSEKTRLKKEYYYDYYCYYYDDDDDDDDDAGYDDGYDENIMMEMMMERMMEMMMDMMRIL